MKNKSVNADETLRALRFYYSEALRKKLLPKLLAKGVSDGAIKTAIRRGGRISQKMIDGIVEVVGATEAELTGEIPLSHTAISSEPQENKTNILCISDIELAVRIISLIFSQNYEPNIEQKKAIVQQIREITDRIVVTVAD